MGESVRVLLSLLTSSLWVDNSVSLYVCTKVASLHRNFIELFPRNYANKMAHQAGKMYCGVPL